MAPRRGHILSDTAMSGNDADVSCPVRQTMGGGLTRERANESPAYADALTIIINNDKKYYHIV